MKNGELFDQRLRDLHALLLSASNGRPGTLLNTLLSNSVIDSPFSWVLRIFTTRTGFIFHDIILMAEVQKAGFGEVCNRTAKPLLAVLGLAKVFQ